MAKVIFTKSNVEAEIADGSKLTAVCEKQGIMFACYIGVCGTCVVNIEEGMENLSERTDNEVALLGDDETLRLACQCKINGGTVKIAH